MPHYYDIAHVHILICICAICIYMYTHIQEEEEGGVMDSDSLELPRLLHGAFLWRTFRPIRENSRTHHTHKTTPELHDKKKKLSRYPHS
ncbi:hypothetical protein KFK09_015110 [Dendrobium nobile]|uniref:Uncharacterized protein n=1 Tax=Dendrobium nobile TaxID=94219 RepID=A0A8T3B509_DENNO|nr:hypothetical protein KFK09_015110 [Dendrobium nobile]